MTVALGSFEPLFNIGLRVALGEAEDIEILDGEGDELLRHGVELVAVPDVVLVDEVRLPSAPVLARLTASYPSMALVVLALEPLNLYRSGALPSSIGCVSKAATTVDLLNAVRVAADKASAPVRRAARPEARARPVDLSTLTRRELEVLTILQEAATHREIADALGISAETARTHSANIRAKLGVSSNRDLTGVVRANTDRK